MADQLLTVEDLPSTSLPSRAHVVLAMAGGLTVKLTVAQMLALLQAGDIPNGSITSAKIVDGTIVTADLATAALTDMKWLSKAIGEYYYADTGESGVDIPPNNSNLYRFVELTAGLTGVGAYNEGALSGESVSGSAPLVLATAIVSLAGSPMSGQTIRLLNTERRVLRAGSAGTIQNDALQDVTGTINGTQEALGGTGVFSTGAAGSNNRPNNGTASTNALNFALSSDTNARTANETRVKNIGVRIFRRIK